MGDRRGRSEKMRQKEPGEEEMYKKRGKLRRMKPGEEEIRDG